MSEHMMRYVIVPFAMMMLSCVAAMPNPALAGAVAPTRPSGGELAQPATPIVASQQPQSLAYYVAENGSDDNPGTDPATPFRTISKGVSVLSPGDTLYIRGGTYHEKVRVSVSGKAEKPITITAYPGESPVMDGRNTLPGDYGGYLVRLLGSHLILSGLEIRNVAGSAVQSSGDHNTIRRMRIHHCLDGAILVGGTGYCPDGVTNTGNIVEDNEVWMTSLIHEGVMQGGNWEGAINVARCPQDTIVRRNTVHETWGIGIQTYEAYGATIEDNVVWNNQMEHFYVNNAPYTLVQRNMSYNTVDTPFLYNGMPGHSIAFCDERPTPISHHVTIINNLTWGGARGFIFFSQQPGLSGSKKPEVCGIEVCRFSVIPDDHIKFRGLGQSEMALRELAQRLQDDFFALIPFSRKGEIISVVEAEPQRWPGLHAEKLMEIVLRLGEILSKSIIYAQLFKDRGLPVLI